MVGDINLEVIIMDNCVWQVPLEEMAEFAFEYNLKAIPYEKTEKGEMLIGILIRTGESILKDGTFLSRTIITNTLYSPVKEYKRLLVYDHVHNNIDYTSENSAHRYESTHVFAVTKYPHFLIRRVADYIVEKIEEENK